MALLSAYITDAEYRARVGSKGTGADATLAAQRTAISRMVEKQLQLAPGAFNSATGTRTFDADGSALLYLRSGGARHYLQSIDADGLEIDWDGDGTYEYAFDTTDAWVGLYPANAVALSEAATGVRLLPVSTAPITRFPKGIARVRITGTWGWAAVPDLIKDLCAHMLHDMRVAELSGQGGFTSFDGSVRALAPDTYFLWTEARKAYGARIPGVA